MRGQSAWGNSTSPLTRDKLLFYVAVVRPLSAGTLLTRDMLTAKKPAKGIPADEIDSLIGKRLKRSVTPDRILYWEDIHDE